MLHKSVLLLAPISLAMASPLLAESYEFKTINPYKSVETSARGINNDGDVVGDFADSTQSAAGTELGFRYDDGKFKKIAFPGARDTDANGINHEGVIVGTYDTDSGDHGYVLDDGNYIALPDPPSQDRFPDFNAINDEGEIVGVFNPVSNVSGNKGFLFSYGNYTVLDCGRFQTEANGINDQGDIVGECADANFTEHAFLLHDGVYTILDFPGSKGTIAFGINEDRDIVGVYTDSVTLKDHGFIVKHVLGTPKWKTVDFPGAMDTKLTGINDHGQLSGTYTTTAGVDKGFRAQKDR